MAVDKSLASMAARAAVIGFSAFWQPVVKAKQPMKAVQSQAPRNTAIAKKLLHSSGQDQMQRCLSRADSRGILCHAPGLVCLSLPTKAWPSSR